MRTFALAAMGTDRPGIIAAVADRLVTHGVNVTDSQMGILRGFFAMTLIVTAPDEVDEQRLLADLESVGDQLHLEAITLRAVPTAPAGALDEPTHAVSVYGADHPGILAAVTQALAAAGVNVCDMRTRVIGDDESVYVMVINVAAPAAVHDDALRAALTAVAERQGVDVTLQPVDTDVL